MQPSLYYLEKVLARSFFEFVATSLGLKSARIGPSGIDRHRIQLDYQSGARRERPEFAPELGSENMCGSASDLR
jgi:hypothetical protein